MSCMELCACTSNPVRLQLCLSSLHLDCRGLFLKLRRLLFTSFLSFSCILVWLPDSAWTWLAQASQSFCSYKIDPCSFSIFASNSFYNCFLTYIPPIPPSFLHSSLPCFCSVYSCAEASCQIFFFSWAVYKMAWWGVWILSCSPNFFCFSCRTFLLALK